MQAIRDTIQPQTPPALKTHFKFKWVDADGKTQGVRHKKGWFDGRTLQLDSAAIPVEAVAHVETHDQFLIVSALAPEGTAQHFAVRVSVGGAALLKQMLDRQRSAVAAHRHRGALEQAGQGGCYREATCPHCGSTIILTAFATTAQLYCDFCDTLWTIAPPAVVVAGERQFRICDECGMFSKPRKFTIFYFYTVLVAHGYYHRITWRCPGCMRHEAWKMLAGNSLFLLGVPVALVQLVRAYTGTLRGPFAGLDRANLKARRGDLRGAISGYRPILDRVPSAAGVKYNLGRALFLQGEYDQAAEGLRLALDDCANYRPAAELLARCYDTLGDAAALETLQHPWLTRGRLAASDMPECSASGA